MKAVLLTDTLQLIFMLGALVSVAVSGASNLGLQNIWESAKKSGRLDFIE